MMMIEAVSSLNYLINNVIEMFQ